MWARVIARTSPWRDNIHLHVHSLRGCICPRWRHGGPNFLRRALRHHGHGWRGLYKDQHIPIHGMSQAAAKSGLDQCTTLSRIQHCYTWDVVMTIP